MVMTACARPPTSSDTWASCAGLWHSTIASARSASAALLSTTSPPTAVASASARIGSTSCTSNGSPSPRASALAMLPAPMRPIFISARRIWLGPAGPRSGLVEEALLDQTGALFGGDLDVPRREQEHLVGDPLHAA